MKKIEAKIVADSICNGHRITTMLLTFPRFILAEFNTHRMFSRNSASSRAIPFEKMVKMVEEDPFIPIAWQLDHKGMQGTKYITHPDGIEPRVNDWLDARNDALKRVIYLHDFDVTKQLCNRLLEPFMWHIVLVTATEWENFFKLRCPKYEYKGEIFHSKKDLISSYTFEKGFEEDKTYLESLSQLDWLAINTSQAEIHMQALAENMWDAYNESVPKELKIGEWHIPFGDKMDESDIFHQLNLGTVEDWEIKSFRTELNDSKIKVATARCARLSYMTFDGDIDYAKDIELHDRLLKDGHLSPFEHCARAMNDIEYYNYIKGAIYEFDCWGDAYGWCANFKGWMSYRFLIENKMHTDKNK